MPYVSRPSPLGGLLFRARGRARGPAGEGGAGRDPRRCPVPGSAGGPRLPKGPSAWRVTRTIAPADALPRAWSILAAGPTGRPGWILPGDGGPASVRPAPGTSQVLTSPLGRGPQTVCWAPLSPRCWSHSWASACVSGMNARTTERKASDEVGLFLDPLTEEPRAL